MQNVLWVGVGGFLGANARYLVGLWAATFLAGRLPVGTFLINVSGSFLLGLFLAIGVQRVGADPRMVLLVGTGFFGSYTTFSTFSVESQRLAANGEWLTALTYVLASVLLGFAGAWVGSWLGQAGAI